MKLDFFLTYINISFYDSIFKTQNIFPKVSDLYSESISKNRNDEILLRTLHFYAGIFFKFQHICNIYVLAQRHI